MRTGLLLALVAGIIVLTESGGAWESCRVVTVFMLDPDAPGIRDVDCGAAAALDVKFILMVIFQFD